MTCVITKNNMDLNFISPYVNIHVNSGEILLHNPVFDTYAKIECGAKAGEKLLRLLKEGVSNDVLLDYMCNELNLTEDDYYYLLKEGIII